MSYQAFYENCSQLTAGNLAGQNSTSGQAYSNAGITAYSAPLTVDSTPSIYCGSTSNVGVALSAWVPPSANYGVGLLFKFLTSGSYNVGTFIRCSVSGGVATCYYGYANYGSSEYVVGRFVSGSATNLFTVSHTFSAPEEHYLYFEAVNDGTGGVYLSLYVNGTQVGSTYHDTSGSAITTAGQVALYIQGSESSSSTAGAHVYEMQTDAQVSTLSGPNVGLENTQSTTFTLTLEVPFDDRHDGDAE